MSSQTCTAGTSAQARIARAARSLRLRAPMAAVDELEPAAGQHDSWTLEATLAECDHAADYIYSVLDDEGLDLRLATTRGPNFVIVATA